MTIRIDHERQDDKCAENLAAHGACCNANHDGTPGQKEPCLGVVPFHELNIIPQTGADNGQ